MREGRVWSWLFTFAMEAMAADCLVKLIEHFKGFVAGFGLPQLRPIELTEEDFVELAEDEEEPTLEVLR